VNDAPSQSRKYPPCWRDGTELFENSTSKAILNKDPCRISMRESKEVRYIDSSESWDPLQK